jgi:hypothetical protein
MRWRFLWPGSSLDKVGLPVVEGSVEVLGLALFHFRDGKIATYSEYYDLATFLRKVGVDVYQPKSIAEAAPALANYSDPSVGA